jgi:hypothetical protein
VPSISRGDTTDEYLETVLHSAMSGFGLNFSTFLGYGNLRGWLNGRMDDGAEIP